MGGKRATGKFETHDELKKFVIVQGLEGHPRKAIAIDAGVSMYVVQEILNRHNIGCRVDIYEENQRLKREWPGDKRIDVIGQNGNTGEHYGEVGG